MSFYHYKKIPISLNGKTIICDDVQLSNDIQLVPRYDYDSPTTSIESPARMWNGSLRIQYYLNSYDYLKQYIYSNYDEPITGNIGGLVFKQGYLSNYSIPIQPNGPIVVKANISFFDQLSGIFTPSNTIANSNTGFIFRSSDIQINNLAGYTKNLLNNFVKASFDYSCNLQPGYSYGDTGINITTADNVFLTEKLISTEIISDDIDSNLPLSGENFGAIFTFINPLNSNFSETFGCSGKIYSKAININITNPHTHTIKINQHHGNDLGSISNVQVFGTVLVITSKINTYPFLSADKTLSYVDNIFIGDTQVTGLVISRPSNFEQIVAPNPFNIVDDILTIHTSYKSYVWPNKLHFTYPSITITGMSCNTGTQGNIIQISGTNFIRISDVFFGGGVRAKFSTLDTQTLSVIVPPNGLTSPILVSSHQRNVSGYSTLFFYPPYINSTSPNTGVWKDIINITGYNFSGITGVYFSGVPASTFSIINTNFIQAATPETGSGYPYGNILLYGTGGYTFSPSIYNPTIPIYSFFPASGFPKSNISIYTKIDTGYLCPSGLNSGYKVRVGGQDTAFFISGGNSTGILTGLFLTGSITDYIYIYKPDGISTSISFNQLTALGQPTVTAISPNTIQQYSRDSMIIYGTNLSFFYDSFCKVILSGGVNGDVQTYPTGTFTSSADGKTLLFNNILLTGNTGNYNVSVQNSYGTSIPVPLLTISAPTNLAWSFAAFPVGVGSLNYSTNGKGNLLYDANTYKNTPVVQYNIVDNNINTFALIVSPSNPDNHNFYISLAPVGRTMSFGVLSINSDTSTFINKDFFYSFADGIPLVNRLIPHFLSYSGSIICFSGLSKVAYSGALTNLNGYLKVFPPYGLSGINEIRICALGGTGANNVLGITEFAMY